jgi:hypothetical protein
MGGPNLITLPSGSVTAPSYCPHSVSSGETNLDAGRSPRRGQVVSVIYKEVRRARVGVIVGDDTKVDLYVVAGSKAVAASPVGADFKAKSSVVIHRRVQVVDGEDRRYPLQAAHAISFAYETRRSL